MDGVQQPPTSTSRKRSKESETESQRIKREKAAERQRRKRERDRKNAAALQQSQVQHTQQQQQQQQQQQSIPAHQQMPPPSQPAAPPQQSDYSPPQDLSPDELVRREKVRASARERQRKHRMLVKQKRMRELGLDMGNEVIAGLEEMQYRPPPDGQYHHPVLPPELHHLVPQPPPPGIVPQPHEPPFPAGAALGGQTFASTLLLSFSCAPLLKQHLLRTLHMTNEELASLEPIIAEAWDRWDHNRRVHFAEQVAKNGGQPPPMPPAYAMEMPPHDPHQQPPHNFPHPNGPGPGDSPTANEFRARFHRTIVDPTPFRNAFPNGQAPTTTPSSTTGSSQAEAIDPHLAATNGTATGSTEAKS